MDKSTIAVIICLIFIILFGQSLFSSFTGYAVVEITTCQGLQDMQNNLAGDYILKNNIDCSGSATWNPDGNGGYYGFDPIGNYENNFIGHFDGDGYKITGLFINRPGQSYVGLFGYTYCSSECSENVEIKNVGLENIDVTGYHHVGGLVGENLGATISNSYSTGSVTGGNEIGGLVGKSRGSSYYDTGLIINSYSTANVNGGSEIGGLVGWNLRTISNSYSTGSVTSTGDNVGGLVGINEGTCNNCFWNTDTSGQTSSACGTGKTTAEMTETECIDAGLNWYDGLCHEPEAPECTVDGDCPKGYTCQDGACVSTGFNTITTCGQLQAMEDNLAGDYILGADIDCLGVEFTPLGYDKYHPFTGHFDGDGYIITNLLIDKSDIYYIGLFGVIDTGAEIKNVGLEDVDIKGYRSVGGLVGNIQGGTISDSYSKGVVSGYSSVGGLVGANQYGTISNSYSSVSVNGDNYVGGFAGYSSAPISNSYSSGIVTGNSDVGGLVGKTTPAGTCTHSFWDTQTSGQGSSACGANGKTTADMQTASTFTDVDWDSTVWNIEDGDYPRLIWEALPECTKNDKRCLGDILEVCTAGAWVETNCATLGKICDSISLTCVKAPPTCVACVAEWKFDEGLGTTAYDSAGNNDGEIHGGANWVTGISGSALEFDGVNDFISVSDSSSLDIGTGDFTISAWIKTAVDDITRTPGIVSHLSVTHVGYYFYIYYNGDCISMRIGDSEGSTGSSCVGASTDITDKEWHHVAVVFDRSGNAYLYVDSSLDGTKDISPRSGDISNRVDLLIGVDTRLGQGYFNGIIDEVKIYNYALSADDVQNLYETGYVIAAPTCTDSDVNDIYPGGLNYYEEGTTTGIAWGTSDYVEKTDYCITDGEKAGRLAEYFCENNQVASISYECPNGCSNGACVEEEIPGSVDLQDTCLKYYTCPDGTKVVECEIKGMGCICNQNPASLCPSPDTEQIICTDSDGGVNYYVKGQVEKSGVVQIDHCDLGTLTEFSCDENGLVDKQYYACPQGCEDGACLEEEIVIKEVECTGFIEMDPCLDDLSCYWDQETEKCYNYDDTKQLCSDPDEGKNYYVQAHTFGFRTHSTADDPERDLRIRTGGGDGCLDDQLVEHYCTEDYFIKTSYINCPSGCQDGVCICEGCLTIIDSKKVCIPYGAGIRLPDNKYCGDEDIEDQLNDGKKCNEDYECESNICSKVGNKCVSYINFRNLYCISWGLRGTELALCIQCGDGSLNPTEECDSTKIPSFHENPDGSLESCEDYGFTSGQLLCSRDCRIDTSGCIS